MKNILRFIFISITVFFGIKTINAQTIDDGKYYIKSSINKSMAVCSNKLTASNLDNIELCNEGITKNQIWQVEYLNNGYYKIVSSIDPEYSLDVAAHSAVKGANVGLYKYHGGDNQQWAIKKMEDGSYVIISKLGKIVLDLYGSRTTPGTNILVYTQNETSNQKFIFEKTEAKPLKDGYYKISNSIDNNSYIAIENNYLANNSNIVLLPDNNSNGQRWYVKHIKDGYYQISSAFNDNYLIDISSGKYDNIDNVQLYKKYDSDNQLWYIKYADGVYSIISKKNNKVISKENDTSNNIAVQDEEENAPQEYSFEVTEKIEEEIPDYGNLEINEGYYVIETSLNNNYSLDIYGNYRFNGTNVEIYNSKHSLNQIWYLKKTDDGYYKILSASNIDICLDISNDNVIINKYTGNDSQKWMIKDIGDGTIAIINKQKNKALDIETLNIANGVNVIINDIAYSVTQKFKITPYNEVKIYKGIDVSSHNEIINWETVSKNIDFAILRLGYGGADDGGDDSTFAANAAACERYNIPYGVYLYSYAIDSANDTQVEVEHIRRKIPGYNPNLGTKVFFDMEDADGWKAKYGIDNNKDLLTAISNNFCTGVENLGYTCGIYANVDWLTNRLDAIALANKFTIWVAIWPNNSSINNFNAAYNLKPSYSLTSYKYWQFTSNGRISGINGLVDLNLGYDIFD